ncbi:MAG: heme-binding domain-containing protein [Sphingobacteriaceae bacterium]
MKIFSRILLALLAILLLAQFVKPEKNIASGEQPNDIFIHYPATPQVQALVKKACYDCHSNNTNYPWYAEIQPLAWWINDHVKDGKRHLNFSEFAGYKPKKANHKLEETFEQVEEHEMPLGSYTLIHKEARLTAEEQQLLIDWAKSTRAKIVVPVELNEK